MAALYGQIVDSASIWMNRWFVWGFLILFSAVRFPVIVPPRKLPVPLNLGHPMPAKGGSSRFWMPNNLFLKRNRKGITFKSDLRSMTVLPNSSIT